MRTEFGARLKELRQRAGFKTARAFAAALQLDENRYTRYERGQVEPNLASLCRMCSVLVIEPNQLLGFAGATPQVATEAGRPAKTSRAWRLASAFASLKHGPRPSTGSPTADGDPLARVRDTADIHARLLTDPGRVITSFLGTAVDDLATDRKAELAALIDSFMGDL